MISIKLMCCMHRIVNIHLYDEYRIIYRENIYIERERDITPNGTMILIETKKACSKINHDWACCWDACQKNVSNVPSRLFSIALSVCDLCIVNSSLFYTYPNIYVYIYILSASSFINYKTSSRIPPQFACGGLWFKIYLDRKPQSNEELEWLQQWCCSIHVHPFPFLRIGSMYFPLFANIHHTNQVNIGI